MYANMSLYRRLEAATATHSLERPTSVLRVYAEGMAQAAHHRSRRHRQMPLACSLHPHSSFALMMELVWAFLHADLWAFAAVQLAAHDRSHPAQVGVKGRPSHHGSYWICQSLASSRELLLTGACCTALQRGMGRTSPCTIFVPFSREDHQGGLRVLAPTTFLCFGCPTKPDVLMIQILSRRTSYGSRNVEQLFANSSARWNRTLRDCGVARCFHWNGGGGAWTSLANP